MKASNTSLLQARDGLKVRGSAREGGNFVCLLVRCNIRGHKDYITEAVQIWAEAYTKTLIVIL